jgi:hypothetical protein
MLLRFVSVTLLLIGVLGGTLGSSFQRRAPTERGGFKVVEADLHVHSHAGDGLLSPFGLVLLAQRQGLHAFAVTDHNRIFGAQASRWFSRLIDGPTVIVGEEITAPNYHLIGLGLSDRVTWRQSLAESAREIHSQGGVAIAAHPGKKYEETFEPAVLDLDGSEIMHPLAHSSSRRGMEMREFYQRAQAKNLHFAAVGSSDYHWFNSLGLCRTYIFVYNNAQDEILEALHSGRTVVYDVEGNMFGDPEFIRLLQEQPIKRDSVAYRYEGSGAIDVFTRSCGWLGLLGLVLFGRRKQVIGYVN